MSRRIREVLVGLFVLGGIALAVFAFAWFSGRLVQSHRRLVSVYFRDAAGLRTGDPVSVLGIDKGKVAGLALESGRVRATVAMDRDVALAVDTKFAIRSVSYLGSDRYVMVVPGTGSLAPTGHRFQGANEALDLEETFLRLDRLLSSLDPTELTGELKSLRDELMETVRSQLTGFNTSFSSASVELTRLSARLDTLVQSISRESSAGKLLSSSELYDEVRKTNSELQSLVKDIKENPERYLRLRFSLFR